MPARSWARQSPLGGVDGLAHGAQEVVDALAVGVEEAALLGGEELVEGRAADAGGADDVGDGRGGVALARRRRSPSRRAAAGAARR